MLLDGVLSLPRGWSAKISEGSLADILTEWVVFRVGWRRPLGFLGQMLVDCRAQGDLLWVLEVVKVVSAQKARVVLFRRGRRQKKVRAEGLEGLELGGQGHNHNQGGTQLRVTGKEQSECFLKAVTAIKASPSEREGSHMEQGSHLRTSPAASAPSGALTQ